MSIEFFQKLISKSAAVLGQDLSQCLTQTTNTTKHSRRWKCLAYILDAITGFDMASFKPKDTHKDKESLLELISFVDALASNAPEGEAKVAFQRTAKRLYYVLHNADFDKREVCVACGERREPDHQCTNARAKMKDIAMATDKDILL